MKAIGFDRYLPVEDPSCFIERDLPVSNIRGRDLLVRVKAISVNPVDVKIRSRTKGVLEELRIPGWDAAGFVEAAGDKVTGFKPGDTVFYAGDINRPGCDCELHLVDERIVGSKPKSLSYEEAAAMPLTTITAWEALFDRLEVGTKDSKGSRQRSILIIGAAGGVGSIAIQLASELAGLYVIATASRTESAEWCLSLGADAIINHHKPFADEFVRIGADEADYILCLNSTEMHIRSMADVIRPQGRICTIVETRDNLPVDINIFQSKSVAFMWELMFTRSMYDTPDIQVQGDLLNETSRLLDKGVLRTTMTKSYGPLTVENLSKAHSMIESGRTIGKIVLSGIPE